MCKRFCGMAFLFFSTVAMGGTSLPVKDNSDLSLTLSQVNYNRIVVKNDKIIEAVFPEKAMAIKRDEQDGSVYVMLAATNPFTLFLTTEAGHHFSVTLNGEESLGKTVEFIPQQKIVAKSTVKKIQNSPTTIAQEAVPEVILAMLTHMEQQKPFADVNVKRQFRKRERWSKGLMLLPKESWEGKLLKGEIIELYNGGKEPLELSQEWFVQNGTLAIKFSKAKLNSGERAMLYRVQGISHG